MSLNLHVCFLEHVTTAGLFLRGVRKHLQHLVCEMSGAGVQTRCTNRMFTSCLLPAADTGLQGDPWGLPSANTVTAAAAVRGNRGINPGSQLYKHRFKGHTTTGWPSGLICKQSGRDLGWVCKRAEKVWWEWGSPKPAGAACQSEISTSPSSLGLLWSYLHQSQHQTAMATLSRHPGAGYTPVRLPVEGTQGGEAQICHSSNLCFGSGALRPWVCWVSLNLKDSWSQGLE